MFEGDTNDAFQTTVEVVDPTSDRLITLPDAGGEVVLDGATQDLTNKTVNGLTLAVDQSRTLTVTGGNKTISGAGATIDLSGDLTLGANFTTAGGDAITFNTTALTSLTLPTTGTLATLSGTETLSNKTIEESTFSGESVFARKGVFRFLESTQATIATLSSNRISSGSGSFNSVTSSTVRVIGALFDDPVLTIIGSISLVTVAGVTGITFSGDTTLFREAASTLATGQNFLVGGSLTVNGALRDVATLTVTGSISLNTALDDGGITFDGDTSLFRSAANTLRTGQDFVVGRDLTVERTVTVSGGLTGNPVLTTIGSISLVTVAGVTGITFSGDTTLFREAASTLATGQNFLVGGSLTVN